MWKDVPGYPNIQAHTDGRIRVLEYRKWMRNRTSDGYWQTMPTRELKVYTGCKYPRVTIPDLREDAPHYQRSANVHVLVAKTHCIKKTGQSIVRHKDGNPLNWQAHNLAWGTHRDNEKDKLLHGRRMQGESHSQSKLTAEQVTYIKENYKPKCRTNGAMAMARKFNVHRTTIENIVSGRTW